MNPRQAGKDTNSPNSKHKQNRLAGIDPRQAETRKRELRKTLVNLFRKVAAKLSLNVSLEEKDHMIKCVK
jgi:hypothetical protein